MTCEEVRIALGAHALGALDPEEALEVDHHLATCEECGAELLELEGVSAFLGKVSERDVELVASPPKQVLDRLLNDRVKRTRRGRILMAVAGSAAVLVVGGTVWTALHNGSVESTSAQAPAAAQQERSEPSAPFSAKKAPAETEQSRDAASDAPRPVASATPSKRVDQGREFSGENKATEYYATVAAYPMESGTELGVRIRGVPLGTTCHLVVVGVDGQREVSQSWVVSRETYADRAIFRSETTLGMEKIQRFEVTDDAGKKLVEVKVRG